MNDSTLVIMWSAAAACAARQAAQPSLPLQASGEVLHRLSLVAALFVDQGDGARLELGDRLEREEDVALALPQLGRGGHDGEHGLGRVLHGDGLPDGPHLGTAGAADGQRLAAPRAWSRTG